MKLREALILCFENMEYINSHTSAPNSEQTILVLSSLRMLTDILEQFPPKQQQLLEASVLSLLRNLSAVPQQVTTLHPDKKHYQPVRLTKAGFVHEPRQRSTDALCTANWMPNNINDQLVSEHFPGLELGWVSGVMRSLSPVDF